MKKTILSIFSILVLATIFISSSGGRTDGRSSSPGDGADCGACHGGSSTSPTDMIVTDIPTAGYITGTTYNITVTVAETGRSEFGFQITAEDDSNAKKGTFGTFGSTSIIHTNTANTLVTQTNPGTNSDAQSWVMEWTAPASGTGNITFYAAGNASNNNGGTSGDLIYTDSEAVIEDPSNVTGIIDFVDNTSIVLYPNPTTNFFTIKNVTSNVTVHNLNGSVVKTFVGNQSIYDVSDLNRGTYLVNITSENQSSVEKLIIQ